jgi:hypothetical protein
MRRARTETADAAAALKQIAEFRDEARATRNS